MLGRDVVLAAGNAGHDVVGFGHIELDITDAERRRQEARPRAARRGHQLRRLDRRRRGRGGRGGGYGRERSRRRQRCGRGRVGGRRRRLRLQRLRLRRRQGLALRRDRPARAAVRLRSHQAGRRGGDGRRQQAPLRRPLLLAVRDRRLQLRRDDAAAGRRPRRGARRPRPGRLPDLHLAPRLRDRAADRGDRVRHPPHGGRAGPAPGTTSLGRSSNRRKSSAKCSRRPRRCSARPAPRPPYSVLATQREHAITLPPWQDGLAGYLAQRGAGAEAA